MDRFQRLSGKGSGVRKVKNTVHSSVVHSLLGEGIGDAPIITTRATTYISRLIVRGGAHRS